MSSLLLLGAGTDAAAGGGGGTAVAIQNTPTGVTWVNTVTSISYTALTVGAGLTNSYLIAIFYALSYETVSGLAMTWNGTTMTKIASQATADASGKSGIEIWALAAPAAGNNTLAATWTGAVKAGIYALTVVNANQAGGATTFPHTLGGNGSSTSPSVTITSAANHYCINGIIGRNGATLSMNPTQLFVDNNFIGNGANDAAGSASVTLSGSFNVSDSWAALAVDIANA